MSLRNFLNNNSSLATILAVVLLLISLGVIILQTRNANSHEAVGVYFYDMSSGQLFAAGSDQVPPISTPSGADSGVRAHVFSCGDCPNNLVGMNAEQVKETGAFIAYLEQLTPRGKEAYLASIQPVAPGAEEPPFVDTTEHTLVRRVEDTKWERVNSREGSQIQSSVDACENGIPARACLP